MVKFTVPHDKNGNQLTWHGDITWKKGYETDPYEFKATLKYNGFSRGRSALNIEWKDTKTGQTYQSGMKMLDDHLMNGGGNTIKGTFGFKKQGTSVLLTIIV